MEQRRCEQEKVHFDSMDHPMRTVQDIATRHPQLSLIDAKRYTALLFGYRSWGSLAEETLRHDAPPSPLDHELPKERLRTRVFNRIQRLRRETDLRPQPLLSIALSLQPRVKMVVKDMQKSLWLRDFDELMEAFREVFPIRDNASIQDIFAAFDRYQLQLQAGAGRVDTTFEQSAIQPPAKSSETQP